jgi:flagellin
MQEIQDMLNRMVTLATQSANGTYDDDTDRANLQKEVDSLKDEINRIAESANFNGISLLDGSMTAKTISDPIAATDTDVFNSIGSAAVKKLMLAQSSTNAVTDVGTKTIVETDATDDGGPSFTVSLDGVSHTLSNAAVAGTSTNSLTLTINSQTISVDENDLADYDADGDGVVAGEELVKAFIEKGQGAAAGSAYTAATATTAAEFKSDGSSGTNTWNVSADGDALKFTYSAAMTGAMNEHFDVSLTPIGQNSETATAGVYTTGKYTAGQNGEAASSMSVEVTTKDGTKLTFDLTNIASDESAGNISTSIAAVTAKDADGNPVNDSQGNPDKLSNYFTVAVSNGAFTFTASNTGADEAKVTGVTFTAGNGGTATLADGAWVDGKDAFDSGTNGYANASTQINVAADKPPVDQLASTTLQLTANELKDGTKIRLGDQTYTIALGKDSQFKDAEGVVYLENEDPANPNVEAIASKLTEVAQDNTTFSVGHSGTNDGYITLKQLSAVKGTTDMSTMDEFAKYIDISFYDADASAQAAADAAQAEADRKAAEDAANEGKSPLTLQIGDTSDSFNQLQLEIADMHVDSLGIEDVDISTQDGASAAIDLIKDAINKVSSTRGDLGAVQNRLEHTANNLSVMTENIQDAESTIRDTDIAEEMMSYTKNNILVQSAQAMLAQANSVPQGVLQLLQ